MKYDLHTHTKYSSDGVLEPENIVKAAKKKGLSGIAITDHDTIRGYLKVKKYETQDFKVICGSEISTERGEVIGLFISSEIKSTTFQEVVEEVKEQDGIVVLPHPFDDVRRTGIYPEKGDIKLIDCVETFNSRCLRQKYNDKAAQFAGENGLSMAAGSDAHFAREVGKAGIITPQDNIRDALIKGDLNVFGEKTSIVNLVLTKMVKTWRTSGWGK
ncbi:PHP domain-containing protein [Methanobacterium sp.]|uniref:PHP domain-containing protein n=1 Tax=Methanobacterium sp. TaxID=2164 RepID=UPI0025EBC461|nr:PHP domain-containing protein [Methanobacterium sp.]MBI5458430.1 PHP domain-containing protein [Methanobacterium sp.]